MNWSFSSEPSLEKPQAQVAADSLNVQDPLSEAWKEDAELRKKMYYPLVDTFRLYAGWLLAWYMVVLAVGSSQRLHAVPWKIALIEELFSTPLILSFTAATFLFLLFTDLHRLMGGGTVKAVGLSFIALILFLFFQANV